MVGIFGITTAESVNLSYPEDSIFEDIFLTSKKTVMDLRGQGADLIIVITHQSIHDDRQLARFACSLLCLFALEMLKELILFLEVMITPLTPL